MMVSFASELPSLMMLNVQVAVVAPTPKFAVPSTTVKSTPGVALPPVTLQSTCWATPVAPERSTVTMALLVPSENVTAVLW
ncbi:MAG: hypothetical protein M5U18_08470 [Dehalococcoidia bacterium]|nr:hypothetical protein [Dehalococcoidia bacterium]